MRHPLPAGAFAAGACAARRRRRGLSASNLCAWGAVAVLSGNGPPGAARLLRRAGQPWQRHAAYGARLDDMGRGFGARRALPRRHPLRLWRAGLGRSLAGGQFVRRAASGNAGRAHVAVAQPQRRAVHRPSVRVPRRPVAGGPPSRRGGAVALRLGPARCRRHAHDAAGALPRRGAAAPEGGGQDRPDTDATAASDAPQPVAGQVLEEVAPPARRRTSVGCGSPLASCSCSSRSAAGFNGGRTPAAHRFRNPVHGAS